MNRGCALSLAFGVTAVTAALAGSWLFFYPAISLQVLCGTAGLFWSKS